jgi:hypothetical protein
MTDQTPEPAADDQAVETEHTTNLVDEQDDVEIDEDQTPAVQDDLGHTFEADDSEDGGDQ